MTGAVDLDYTLSTNAAAAGINKVTFGGIVGGESDTLTVQAVSPTTSVVLDDDSDVASGNIQAGDYTGALTISASDSDLDTRVTTIAGGSGSDTLQITGTTGSITVDDTDMGSVTGIETVELLGSKNIGLTLAAGNAADGVTLTVDSSSLTGNATINAQADTDGLIVVTAGTGDDTIQGSSSDNGDSISAGAGDDTISFGSADLTVADTVDGGAGANTLSFNEALAHALEDADFTKSATFRH